MANNERFYDHGAWLAERRQDAPRGVWESVEGHSPIIHVQQALQPTEQTTGAIVASQQGRQVDDAQTVAKGTLIRSLPVIALSFPLSIGVCALAWLSGIVQAGFRAYVVSVLVLWGAISLYCYSHIARQDHTHSFYGAELRKIDAHERIAHHEIDARERLAIRALETHERLITGRRGQ